VAYIQSLLGVVSQCWGQEQHVRSDKRYIFWYTLDMQKILPVQARFFSDYSLHTSDKVGRSGGLHSQQGGGYSVGELGRTHKDLRRQHRVRSWHAYGVARTLTPAILWRMEEHMLRNQAIMNTRAACNSIHRADLHITRCLLNDGGASLALYLTYAANGEVAAGGGGVLGRWQRWSCLLANIYFSLGKGPSYGRQTYNAVELSSWPSKLPTRIAMLFNDGLNVLDMFDAVGSPPQWSRPRKLPHCGKTPCWPAAA